MARIPIRLAIVLGLFCGGGGLMLAAPEVSTNEYTQGPKASPADGTMLAPKECRPAEPDPEGHWGPVTDGFQMSIRTETNVFMQYDSIVITTVLRNVTTNTVKRMSISRGPIDGAEEFFIVEDEAHKRWETVFPMAGFSTEDLPAKTEVKHEYDFYHDPLIPGPDTGKKPGAYKIQVQQKVWNTHFTNVSSGVLEFKILPHSGMPIYEVTNSPTAFYHIITNGQ